MRFFGIEVIMGLGETLSVEEDMQQKRFCSGCQGKTVHVWGVCLECGRKAGGYKAIKDEEVLEKIREADGFEGEDGG